MKAGDILAEFANFAFLILLIIFVVFYIVIGNRFEYLKEFIEAILPLSIFGIPFLIRVRMLRLEKRKKDEMGDKEIVLYLEYFDKFKAEIVSFLIGFMVYSIPFITGFPDKNDFLQALFAFVVVFLWQKSLFNKQ